MRKPAPLRPGDTIGICSPASPLPPQELADAVTMIEARGYRVKVSPHALDTHPDNSYLAGTDGHRAQDLNTLFADTSVRAIFAARGGYGCSRLLPLLDWETIRANPKLFIGYSDLTSLHCAFARHAGFPTVHGAMLLTLMKSDEFSRELFWKTLESREPLGVLPASPQTLNTICGGTAEGKLAGGCLTLLGHLCGTPYAPDFTDKIVLIEDVGEAVYRADRLLTQLKLCGLFDNAVGFVIGHITGWKGLEGDESRNDPETLWRDTFADLGKPTIFGFPFGHEPSPLPLPLGVRAKLDADAKTLTLLEALCE